MQPIDSQVPVMLSSFIGAEALEESLQKVKKVVELFIKNFSSTEAPDWSEVSSPVLLSEEDKVAFLNTFSAEEIKSLGGKKKHPHFFLVGKGSHQMVWGHPAYPQVVFKIMEHEKAYKQAQVAYKALELSQKIPNCWIQIPKATVLAVGKISVYVEERLPLGLDMDEHEEFWARVFTYYQTDQVSELFKSNLETLVSQIQLLVEKVGFWDIGLHNLPEIRLDGRGVCGTDFENVKEDLSNVSEGIQRLACLFPLPSLVEGCVQRYQQEVPKLLQKEFEQYERVKKWYSPDAPLLPPKADEIEEKFQRRLQARLEELEAFQQAIQHYDLHGYLPANQFVLRNLDSLTFQEKQLAELLLKKIHEQLAKNGGGMTMRRKRYLQLQPSIEKDVYTYQSFISVLEFFKQQGLVISWSDDYKYRSQFNQEINLTCHDIYFS